MSLFTFAGGDGTPQAPGHVGTVIGNGKMIEAYAAGYPIRIATYGRPSSPPGDQVAVGVTAPDRGEVRLARALRRAASDCQQPLMLAFILTR
jgi:cell wall-associated NlpC family hydrolase